MKRNAVGFILIFSMILLLSWCSDNQAKNTTATGAEVSCSESFTVNAWAWQSLDLKAKVVADNVKNILSNNAGNIEYFNCEKWKKVTEKTLIAKIKPDYNDPNIQNLVNQSTMLSTQIANTRGTIVSTKNNFDTQLNSLNTQKANLETQLRILNNSYTKISEQKDFWVSDIDKQKDSLNIQLETLDTQISDLNKLKSKLESSKQADIDKLNLNLANTRTQIKSMIWGALLQIDEIFWISKENEDKNDAYADLLGAKNSSLTQEVKDNRQQLKNKSRDFNNFSNDDISNYLQSLNDLEVKAKKTVKESITAVNLSEATINNFYAIFSQYESGAISAKNGIDTIVKSLDTVGNTYDSQILNIEIQINGAENSKRTLLSNIDNIESNKLGTYTTSVELQKNQSQSQIETAKTGISGISSQIESLKSQKQIQLNQLNSWLSQLQSSLNTININLSSQSIYAGINGTVKEKSGSLGNKVGPSSLLCQILPTQSSLKLQVFSSYNLTLPISAEFTIDGKKYATQLTNKLPYQDSITKTISMRPMLKSRLKGKR